MTERRATPAKPPRGALRQTLIDAALACIESNGMHALTLREVAKRAGVSHQAPYRHFVDRSELLAAAAERGFARLLMALQKSVQTAPVDGRLEALLRAYIRFAVQEPTLFRVMFSPEVADKAPYPALQALADESLALVWRVVEEEQSERRVRAGNTLDYVATAWALAHGLAGFFLDGLLRRRGYSPRTADAIAVRAVAILRAGMSDG